MTPSTQAHILHICAQIEAKGLTISSGLVKAKLNEKLPLQQILAGIAAYKNGVRADKSTNESPPSATEKQAVRPASHEAILAQLEKQQVLINSLNEEVDELKRQISKLQKSGDS